MRMAIGVLIATLLMVLAVAGFCAVQPAGQLDPGPRINPDYSE